MVVFLAPVAVAGYLYWEKKKKEEGLRNQEANESPSEEEGIDKLAKKGDENCSIEEVNSVDGTVDMNDDDDNNSTTSKTALSRLSAMASSELSDDDEETNKVDVASSIAADGLKAKVESYPSKGMLETKRLSSIERTPSSRATPAATNRKGPWAAMIKFFEDGPQVPQRHQAEDLVPPMKVSEDGQKYLYVNGQRIAMPKIAYK